MQKVNQFPVGDQRAEPAGLEPLGFRGRRGFGFRLLVLAIQGIT